MLRRFPRIFKCQHLTLNSTIQLLQCSYAVKLLIILPLDTTGGSAPDPRYRLAFTMVAGAYHTPISEPSRCLRMDPAGGDPDGVLSAK